MPQKPLPPKRKFEFGEEDLNAMFDVYVDGTKVLNGHNVIKGHVYLHLPEDTEMEVSFEPHDPRRPIEAILTGEGLEPYVDEAAIEQQIKEEEARKLRAAKEEAAAKAREEIKKRQEERFKNAKKTKEMQSGGVIPKPEAPE